MRRRSPDTSHAHGLPKIQAPDCSDRRAFDSRAAVSCYEFEDGATFLIADVSIECTNWGETGIELSSEHGFAKAIASVAILAYAVGCWVLNAVILRLARRAIKRKESTTLSTASAFLHGECA